MTFKPKVFTIGLVWETSVPSSRDIEKVLDLIEKRINVRNVFCDTGRDSFYKLKGMICYYGKHYDAYFYNETQRHWWLFDDATVKQVGSTWKGVKEKCVKGHFQPSILFYEKEETKSQAPTPVTEAWPEQPLTSTQISASDNHKGKVAEDKDHRRQVYSTTWEVDRKYSPEMREQMLANIRAQMEAKPTTVKVRTVDREILPIDQWTSESRSPKLSTYPMPSSPSKRRTELRSDYSDLAPARSSSIRLSDERADERRKFGESINNSLSTLSLLEDRNPQRPQTSRDPLISSTYRYDYQYPYTSASVSATPRDFSQPEPIRIHGEGPSTDREWKHKLPGKQFLAPHHYEALNKRPPWR